VCIARALINRPALVLADEPTGSLDADNERAVMELFQKMHDRGQTIVMVTHDLSVGQRADRQVQLEHGRVAGEFLTQAQDDEAIDEVLEYLWLKQEGDELAHETCVRGAQLATDRLLERMRSRGILGPRGGAHLHEEGQRRARSLIRRQRLAEKLFSETFQIARGPGRGGSVLLRAHPLPRRHRLDLRLSGTSPRLPARKAHPRRRVLPGAGRRSSAVPAPGT
jgi:energy-coupling factor transporter ATP-binding protein EcfA2